MVFSDRAARMALSRIVDVGDPELSAVVEQVGAPATLAGVVEGSFGAPLARRAASADLDSSTRLPAASSIRFVVPGDEEWPDCLADLGRGQAVQRRGGIPFGLWLRGPGHLAAMVERAVAVVGSRAATAYGSGMATELAAELAEHGVTVISGGAYGIDAAAHRGALAVDGPTFAIIANGVDVSYPPGNRSLFDSLGKDRLLVSELPPGAHPSRVRFLARNRLIAALSLGTVVVEAALRSGARNTASWAIECHRQLMAVPGPVHSTLSAAPHLMIRNGQATLVTGTADVLEMVSGMGVDMVGVPRGSSRPTDDLDGHRLAVFEAVPARRRLSVGAIALTAGVSIPDCLAHLAALESTGLVDGTPGGWRVVPTMSGL
jgi:DNA processing protein